MSVQLTRRRSGLLVPLFSMPSTQSWGIGEIRDLEYMTDWLQGAGQGILQLLPITEMPPTETSPYGALSAMAIDPQFITLQEVEDVAAVGGELQLEPDERIRLDRARTATTVDYRIVRALKHAVLWRAFRRFLATEWAGNSSRAAGFGEFRAEAAWWLDDYALFRALHAHYEERPWIEWPEPIRRRRPRALEIERGALAEQILFRQYLQWVASGQWAKARARSGRVSLFGDLPFMVSGDSADVWARQDQFRLDGSVGVPPDAFSVSGQDWGLPAYRWNVVADRGFDWLKNRVKRMAELFDGCRVDHVVGFYRTFVRPLGGGAGEFTPPDEALQLELGERVLDALGSAGIELVAEDLGTVPGFVRDSLVRLAVPGYKVFRWERDWDTPGQPFRDPADYPVAAVATSGTHDTEPLVVWWEGAPADERRAVLATPSIAARLSEADRHQAIEALTPAPALRAALLETLFASRADLVVLPIQDVFGWSERVNQPATVSEKNWTWRLPWPSDRMSIEPEARAVGSQLRAWAANSGRNA